MAGSSRFLNTIYATDLTVSGETSFAGITATGLTVNGAATVTGTLTLTKTTDLSGTANNSPALIIGGAATAAHIEIDANEIQGKATGTTTGEIFINNDGGKVNLSKSGKIYANDGTFRTQTLEVNGSTYYFNSSGNINANGITATTATLGNASITNGEVQDFHVNGTLKTFKHDIQHIANLGGNFLVTPSFTYSKSTAQVTRVTGQSTYNLQISLTDNSTITTEIGGIAWTANSKIKAAGKINGIDIGTCDGTISSITTSSNTMIIRILVDDDVDISSISTTATDYSVSDFTVMITMVSGTNPIGIYMTADDPNSWPATNSKGKSSISIYGGTAPGTGMSATTPVVRIGYLAGLPQVNDSTPSGWGIYTNHGYFNGVIVSQEGKIGGWTLGSEKIYSGSHNTWSHASNGLFLGTTRIAGGNGGTWYLDQAGTGKIGRWTFASNGEFSTTVSSNTAGMGNNTYAFWAGAASGNAANAPFRIKYDGSAVFTNATIGDPDGYHVTVSNTDVGIFEDATSKRASFGETTIIGKPYVSGASNNESHVEIDYRSLQLVDKENDVFFRARDFRDTNGIATMTDNFIGDGEKTSCTVRFDIESVIEVAINQTVTTAYTREGREFSFTTAPAEGSSVTIKYTTKSEVAKEYTLGLRSSNTTYGALSVAEGYYNTVSGHYSHGEGYRTMVTGDCSHAEGNTCYDENDDSILVYTTASGAGCHAEGSGTKASNTAAHSEGLGTVASGHSTHAEGYRTTASNNAAHSEGYKTIASGEGSHAEGIECIASANSTHAEGGETEASGNCSHAQNYKTKAIGIDSTAAGLGTLAKGAVETVIGMYNSPPENYDSNNRKWENPVFTIGNGSSDDERSNAFTVNWLGDVEMYMYVTIDPSTGKATSGTPTDLALRQAIEALGWVDDVIS